VPCQILTRGSCERAALKLRQAAALELRSLRTKGAALSVGAALEI